MTEYSIFYSWQSDLPDSTNREFLEEALNAVAGNLVEDEEIIVDPVIDRDTLGVPGAPDIADTILNKIDRSQVFVCDISIINSGQDSRATPNPNVLLELGYALKGLGWERTIMVMNSAFGGTDRLPFDLRTKRVITYQLDESSDDRTPVTERLISGLEEAVRAIIEIDAIPKQSPARKRLDSPTERARRAILDSSPDQGPALRDFQEWLVGELEGIAPDLSGAEIPDEKLLLALQSTLPIVTEYSELADSVSAMNSAEAALALFKGLGPILERYQFALGKSGAFRTTDFDFWKFLGHELLTTQVSFYVRDDRFDIISDLMEEGIYIENGPQGRPTTVRAEYASKFLGLLDHRNRRLKSLRVSIHADILNERHSESPLASLVPMRQLIEADFLLFLRKDFQWIPWSVLYIGGIPPRYLVEAESSRYAERLLRPVGVNSVEELRGLVRERKPTLQNVFRHALGVYPLQDYDPNLIGTK
ncbi:MAG: hypothetical protein IIA89_02055 [Chloroflexi bacterium]|nr:hypothetical protein [Chloroflexota bacterium]